jgi:hypothetical protein
MAVIEAASKKTLVKLNHFLRGEMAAVEVYKMAIEAVERLSNTTFHQELAVCMESHVRGVGMLRDWIMLHGGEPARDAGMWGTFAKLVEGGARAFGEKAALGALAEGEDRGLDDYRSVEPKLDLEARNFLLSQVIPEQEKTHVTVSSLKKMLG